MTNITKSDYELIIKIVDRAEALANARNIPYIRWSAMLDLETTHQNTPLKLSELHNADDGNFAHDVWGIHANINRSNGTLQNCFHPRFAA